MSISQDLLQSVLLELSLEASSDDILICPVRGGDINEAYKLEVKGESFFIKVNDADLYPSMFEAEAKGLALLRSCSRFHIPEVLGLGASGGHQFLAMEYLDQGAPSDDFWELFANRLAGMHRCTNEYFGLDHSNYIGSLKQNNPQSSSWVEFFTAHRISPLVKKAVNNGSLSLSSSHQFDSLYARLEDLIPTESPSLVHGDLWSGNFMPGPDGDACIYDPAVYFGHREMDLAMSKLFGGFDPLFYSYYHEQYPLETGWAERVDIHNLYPLLVHVLLFGGGYSRQVQSILNRFIG